MPVWGIEEWNIRSKRKENRKVITVREVVQN